MITKFNIIMSAQMTISNFVQNLKGQVEEFYYTRPQDSAFISTVILFLFVAIWCAWVHVKTTPEEVPSRNIMREMIEEHRKEINDAIYEGYSIYLDGTEVDASKIDINLYKSTINHEQKSIFLTYRD